MNGKQQLESMGKNAIQAYRRYVKEVKGSAVHAQMTASTLGGCRTQSLRGSGLATACMCECLALNEREQE